MSSLVLDSFPTAEISPPSTVQINTSPSYHGKRRLGQPLLGAQPQRSSSYIVPMIDSSPRVKELMDLLENDTSPVKPLKSYTEILKDEQEKTETPVVSKKVYNKEFKEDTKDFLRTPNYNCNDRYFLSQLKVSTSVKNTANLANIVAAAKPSKSKPKPKSSKPKMVKPKTPVVKKKKLTTKVKKLTSFRILDKKKY